MKLGGFANTVRRFPFNLPSPSTPQAESIEISKSGKRAAVEGIDLDVHGIEQLKREGVPQTDDS